MLVFCFVRFHNISRLKKIKHHQRTAPSIYANTQTNSHLDHPPIKSFNLRFACAKSLISNRPIFLPLSFPFPSEAFIIICLLVSMPGSINLWRAHHAGRIKFCNFLPPLNNSISSDCDLEEFRMGFLCNRKNA